MTHSNFARGLRADQFTPQQVRSFWRGVRKTRGCWWKGKPTPSNARAVFGNFSGTRVAYALHFGEVPEGLFVCHHCDNPFCVRGDHLFLGTARDNSRDMFAKGRNWKRGPWLLPEYSQTLGPLMPPSLDEAVEILGPRRAVYVATVCGLYGIERKTASDIARGEGISRERVRQVLVKARAILESEKVKPAY